MQILDTEQKRGLSENMSRTPDTDLRREVRYSENRSSPDQMRNRRVEADSDHYETAIQLESPEPSKPSDLQKEQVQKKPSTYEIQIEENSVEDDSPDEEGHENDGYFSAEN